MIFSKFTEDCDGTPPAAFETMFFCTAVLSYAAFYAFYRWYRRRHTTKARMDGKVVVVTGATSGVGYETAKELACRGARVIITGRDIHKGLATQVKIIRETGNNEVIFRELDLQSFTSVRNFVFDLMHSEDRLDVLINNAATCGSSNTLTNDRLPREPQINHFAPFMLTMLLVEIMKISKPSRIINVTSVMHHFGRVNPMTFEKPARDCWGRRKLYCDTKVANILFTRKLSAFLAGTGVTANTVQPGWVYSHYFRHLPLLVRLVLKFVLNSAQDGAQGIVNLAAAPHLQAVTGRHFSGCGEAIPNPRATDSLTAERLWRVSERVVGFRDYQH